MTKRIFITGAAGFIGFHLSERLLSEGFQIVGIDNLNDYYDVNLKKDRLAILLKERGFSFHRIDLSEIEQLKLVLKEDDFGSDDKIVHLAAQAGVFYGQINPDSYVRNNLIGFYNILEVARLASCNHLIYASSSSVYGGNTKMPFSTHDSVDHPVSLYAATKKSNELLAHVYSYTYKLPTTGLRFFSVYGPYGRPDMALFLFTKAILTGKPITVYNKGEMFRDFTYVEDIVEGVVRLMDHIPEPDPEWNGVNPNPASSWVPYKIYNIGNHESVKLTDFIAEIEEALDRKAIIDLQPMRLGDVKATYADIDDLSTEIGFRPYTPLRDGIKRFIEWYLEYYEIR